MDKSPSPVAPTVFEPARQHTISESEPAPTQLAERYEILDELGSGGMGRVYRARDRETGEVVALKVLRPEVAAEPSMAERFKNELRLARRITHKNVCRIYDFNRVGSTACISMEYVDGETLRARLDRGGALPAARVTSLARQICAGLAEAHAQGVIHRDLKPENIMVTASGLVKLMDFGIARSLSANVTTQTLIGTPSYMAPEQAQGRGVDARSDIYALGLILYECLSGRRAFTGATPVEVAIKQLQERPQPLRRLRADVPPALEAMVMRCLEKDPARRFVSVDQAVKALAGTGSAAATPGPTGRRWPWLVAAAALLIAGGVWRHRHAPPHLAAAVAQPAASAAMTPVPPPVGATVPAANSPAELRTTTPADESVPAQSDHEPPLDAFQRLQQAAETGDAAAQLRLAQMYFKGPQEIRNEGKAREWLQRAAEQGNAEAEFALGMMYEHGRGGERDIRAAVSWYERAAAAGNTNARRSLARLSDRPARRARMR